MIRQITLSLCVLLIAGALAWRIVHTTPPAPKGEEAAEHAEEHGDEHAHEHEHEGGGMVHLTEAQRQNARLGIVEAGPAKIKKVLPLFGKIAANEEHIAHLMPRFPGVVKVVKKRLGDKVERGEVLATVESNESLTSYNLTVEIAGTVIEKDASPGEFVKGEKAIFVIADLSTVWVDLSVYRQDFAQLREGVRVWVEAEEGAPAMESTLSYLSPFGAESTQTMLARAVISNPKGDLRPGLFVTAEAMIGEKEAAVTVKAGALQTLGEETVVFVEEGDAFEARAVEIGERDREVVEIVSGLKSGEKYVAENSFILKAEIKKGEAEHEH